MAGGYYNHFNDKLDHHKFVVIPVDGQVGYFCEEDGRDGWGNWHLCPEDVIFCNKVTIELGETIEKSPGTIARKERR